MPPSLRRGGALRLRSDLVQRSAIAPFHARDFLSDVSIKFGPADTLAKVLTSGDAALRSYGINLTFASLEDLLLLNEANRDSWRPLLPVFDPGQGTFSAADAFAIIGYDTDGRPATAHAFRQLRLDGRSLKEEIESLRIFYSDPHRAAEESERIKVTAPSAAEMSEGTVFSGAAWFRPDFRKIDLLKHIQPIVRALCFTRWSPNQVVSFMAPEIVRGGVAARAHFPHVEWTVAMTNTPVKRNATIGAALVFATAVEQLEHLEAYASAANVASAERQTATSAV